MKLIFFDYDGTIAHTSLKENKHNLNQQIINSIKKLSENYTLIIISNSSSSTIRRKLKKANIENCFSEILGYETRTRKKENIKNILDIYPAEAKNSLMITDTFSDITEAKKAKVSSIAVTWGRQSEKYLKQAKPHKILSDPQNLTKLVNNFFTKN